jgi:hypothetical protein
MQTSSINNTDFATTTTQQKLKPIQPNKLEQKQDNNTTQQKKSVMQMPKHKLCNKTSSQKNLKSINTTKQKKKNKLHT